MEASGSAAARLGPADLGPAFRRVFRDHRFVVVSNREPYEHVWDEQQESIEVRQPAGGLTSALDPLMQAVGGFWVAWGSGDADAEVVDERQCVRLPPDDPSYSLRRLWLSEPDINQYYYGYANQFLWPLCHLRPALTRVRQRYWDRYRDVNRRFADAALEVAGEKGAAIWFQDYHLALAPGFLREAGGDHTLAHFWHIPWPPLEIFRVASTGPELLEGLLANDLLGFHLPLFCDNFLRCAESMLHARVDWDRRAVEHRGRVCYVRALPISVDVAAFQAAANNDSQVARAHARYAPEGGVLGIGVDRIDYSKGLEEKLAALDLVWERHPEFRERFSYLQIGVPSRTGIDAYDWLNEKVDRMAWSINDRYGTATWKPVHLLKDSLPWERLAVLYRAADLCIVSSLQDGMNLVAKEYVASQGGTAGVLVLSKFAGAAEELDGSIEANPYDVESFAASIVEALLMPEAERHERLHRLRGSLRTIYDWLAEVFTVWGAVARGDAAPLSAADRWDRIR